MNDVATPTAVDDFGDLLAAIGTDRQPDAQLRLACLRAAIEATPKYDAESQVAEVMLTARRFARFVLDGSTPSLRLKPNVGRC